MSEAAQTGRAHQTSEGHQTSRADRADRAHQTSRADPTWSIAQLATEFGVTHRTIRFYEDKGLISPTRLGSRRLFGPRDRVRLELILRGRRLGFALEQIRRIVDMYDQDPGEAGQLRYLLEQIAGRRAELKQRRLDIRTTLAELDRVERRCRQALDLLEPTRPPTLPSRPSSGARIRGSAPVIPRRAAT